MLNSISCTSKFRYTAQCHVICTNTTFTINMQYWIYILKTFGTQMLVFTSKDQHAYIIAMNIIIHIHIKSS